MEKLFWMCLLSPSFCFHKVVAAKIPKNALLAFVFFHYYAIDSWGFCRSCPIYYEIIFRATIILQSKQVHWEWRKFCSVILCIISSMFNMQISMYLHVFVSFSPIQMLGTFNEKLPCWGYLPTIVDWNKWNQFKRSRNDIKRQPKSFWWKKMRNTNFACV